MLNLRPVVGWVVRPTAQGLLRVGVTPDAVTVAGTVFTVATAVGFLARGSFGWGTFLVTTAVLIDSLDGTMARMRGGTSRFGAFLDSTMDRIADAAVLGSLAYWYGGRGDDQLLLALALYGLTTGVAISYAKARAESLGMTANVGITERPERLIIVLAGTGFDAVGVSWAVPVALWVLAVASTITVLQRILVVRRQAQAQVQADTPTTGA